MGGVRGRAGRAARAAAAALAAALAVGACRERAEAVQEAASLRDLVRQRVPGVERATGLAFKREPLVEQRTRAEIRDYLIRKLDEELPPAELRGIEASYRLFGLLPESLSLRETFVGILTEQVAGYYDPDSSTLYIAADLSGLDSLVVRTTVSHELVHALQHQYVPLDSVLDVERQNDRRVAAQAVLEGQATLAQTLVMMPELSLDRLPSFWESRSVLRKQQALMPQYARAPLWLREMLVFPYLGGADFVRALRLRRPDAQPFGNAWPVSTEQILHPDRYFAGDQPTTLAFHDAAADVVYEDGLGEFEIRVLFMVLLADSTDAVATPLAEGWDGDRYRLYDAGGGQHALAWYTVWDGDADADEFARGLEDAWRRRPPPRTARRHEIRRFELDGMPAVRLLDAPPGWRGWRQPPEVRVER